MLSKRAGFLVTEGSPNLGISFFKTSKGQTPENRTTTHTWQTSIICRWKGVHFAFRGQQSTVSDCCSRSLARAPTHKTIRLHNVNSAYNSSSIVFNFQNSLITTRDDQRYRNSKVKIYHTARNTANHAFLLPHQSCSIDRSCFALRETKQKLIIFRHHERLNHIPILSLFPFSTYIIQ